MKVLIADSAKLFRSSVALALQQIFGGAEVTQVGSAEAAVKALEGAGPFDVVLFDTQLPDIQGAAAVREVVAAAEKIPVVVLSDSEDAKEILGAIEAGARGYILKSSNVNVLQHGLSLVLSGETYIAVPASAVAKGSKPPATRPASALPGYSFTRRQVEIVRLLARGHSNKQIAHELGMIEGTVKVHVSDIIRKLGVRNRTQVAILAAREHLDSD